MNEVTETEARVNNQAFLLLRAELEAKYVGQWIVIADGKFLGAAERPEELNHFALNAHHRIVMQMGQTRPHDVELGWQFMFV